jgi:hypothetical protein
MSARRFSGRKAGAKIGKNLNKKGKGWKNPMHPISSMRQMRASIFIDTHKPQK